MAVNQPIIDLAAQFIAELINDMSEEDFKEFVHKTQTDFRHNICWSHDYCDSNVTMLTAFKKVQGRELDLWNEADTDLTNAAWDHAKRLFANKE